MTWRQGKGVDPGYWMGPMRVVVHENAQTIWTTLGCKLYRCAPEHVRPVTANEAREIPIQSQEPSVSNIAQQLQNQLSQGTNRNINLPVEIPIPNGDTIPIPAEIRSEHASQGQPDDEPEIPSHQSTQSTSSEISPEAHNPITHNVNPNPSGDPAGVCTFPMIIASLLANFPG